MGKEIYSLHDNGRKLFTTARECTPMQRFVYVLAKNHHTDDPKSKADPGGLKKANDFRQSTSKFH